MKVRFSYLSQQFADPAAILADLARFVPGGDFTLGAPVAEFEHRFAAAIGARHAIGVGSGTDALKLALKAIGVGPGDEVITAANTFIATAGAIAETGARPVFVDVDDGFCMNCDRLEAAITPATRAIMPVSLTGNLPDMDQLLAIADAHDLPVVEDACQGILAAFADRNAGTFGVAAGFSLHPLKNINVWGDGGVVVTDDDEIAGTLRLLRNHGLKNRDEVAILGCNSRLDSVQALVGNHLIGEVEAITAKRRANAAFYDQAFAGMSGIRVPPRDHRVRHVFHLYMIFAERRDELHAYCQAAGIETKIHYPIPLYRQAGLAHLGHRAGDFPVTDRQAREILSLPVDQYLSDEQLAYVAETVTAFCKRDIA